MAIAINCYVINKIHLSIAKMLSRYLLPDLSMSTTGRSATGGHVSAVNIYSVSSSRPNKL